MLALVARSRPWTPDKPRRRRHREPRHVTRTRGTRVKNIHQTHPRISARIDPTRARERPNASTSSAIAIGFASTPAPPIVIHRPSSRTLDFFLPPAIALAALAAFDSGAFGGILDRLRGRACTRERARAPRGAGRASMRAAFGHPDRCPGCPNTASTHRPFATQRGVCGVYACARVRIYYACYRPSKTHAHNLVVVVVVVVVVPALDRARRRARVKRRRRRRRRRRR